MFEKFKENYSQIVKKPVNEELILNPPKFHQLSSIQKQEALVHLAWLLAEGKDIQFNDEPLVSSDLVDQFKEIRKQGIVLANTPKTKKPPKDAGTKSNLQEKIRENPSPTADDYSIDPTEIEELVVATDEEDEEIEQSSNDINVNPYVYNHFQNNIFPGCSLLQKLETEIGEKLKACSEVMQSEFYKLFRINGVFGAGERSFRELLETNRNVATNVLDSKLNPVDNPEIQTKIDLTYKDTELLVHETNKLLSYHAKGSMDRFPEDHKTSNGTEGCAIVDSYFHFYEVQKESKQLAYTNTELMIKVLEERTAQIIDKRDWIDRLWDAIKAIFSDNDIPKIGKDSVEPAPETPKGP